MFTSQKIGRTVFVSLYFDKIVYYANAMDGMYVNAHKKWPSHKFLVCTSLLFNKNIPQVAARATRLQWLKIEQKHRMTSSTWFRGCRTKWVIGHRTWSIIGHSTIRLVCLTARFEKCIICTEFKSNHPLEPPTRLNATMHNGRSW